MAKMWPLPPAAPPSLPSSLPHPTPLAPFARLPHLLHQPRSFLVEGTRLLDTVSDQYAVVHLSLLPSSILLGPNALRERRSAADDGAANVFVTAGSLRKALRNAGVLLGDADDRVVSRCTSCFHLVWLLFWVLWSGAKVLVLSSVLCVSKVCKQGIRTDQRLARYVV